MERALTSFRNGDQGLNETCRLFDIPKPTFKRHLSRNKFASGLKKSFGRHCTLTDGTEGELVQYVLVLQEHLFGITRKDLMSLAFQVAERNKIPHVFNKEKETAGKTWFVGFLKTPSIEATSTKSNFSSPQRRVQQ